MAKAMRLVDHDGVTRAWMCGVCFHVGPTGFYVHTNADEKLVGCSEREANSCCVCRTCGAENPREGYGSLIECASCSDRRRIEWEARCEAEREEKMKTHSECFECDGTGDRGLCHACDGEGWILRDDTAQKGGVT